MRRNTKHDLRRTLIRTCGGLTTAFLLGPWSVHAEIFPLPTDGSDIIGEVRYTRARNEDTLIDIARMFSVGQEEILMANPTVDRWLPREGTQVMIPRQFILPDAPRAGIVVNIPEMRLYYFPVQYSPVKKPEPKPALKPAALKPGAKGKDGKDAKDAKGKTVAAAPPPPPKPAPTPSTDLGEPITKPAEVITYPVSMGRMDWRTPLGKTQIQSKIKDPTWTPPESIRREHAQKGDILPAVVPAGPDNPLGRFAMRLGVAGYLIHGTDEAKASGIGMRVTHGCMRMYNEDVAKLFPLVAVGTPVYLVNQPVKLGWQNGTLYMEVSQPLDEDAGIPLEWSDDALADSGWSEAKIKEAKEKRAAIAAEYLLKLANARLAKESASHQFQVDQAAVKAAVYKPNGIPVAIGKALAPTLQAAPSQPAPTPGYGTGQYPTTPPYNPGQPTPAPYANGQAPYGQPVPNPGPYGTTDQVAPMPYGSGQYNQPRVMPSPAIPGQYNQPRVMPNPATPGQYNQPRTPPNPYGTGQYGQVPAPTAPYGTGQYGQPPAVNNPYGTGQYGQPAYGSGQYGQPPAADNPYGSDPYGQPTQDQYGWGQPQPDATDPGAFDAYGSQPPQDLQYNYGTGQPPDTSAPQEPQNGMSQDPYAPDEDDEEEETPTN